VSDEPPAAVTAGPPDDGLVPLSLGAVLLVVLSAAAAAAIETRTVTSFWRASGRAGPPTV
jgi:hypothetical protein